MWAAEEFRSLTQMARSVDRAALLVHLSWGHAGPQPAPSGLHDLPAGMSLITHVAPVTTPLWLMLSMKSCRLWPAARKPATPAHKGLPACMAPLTLHGFAQGTHCTEGGWGRTCHCL